MDALASGWALSRDSPEAQTHQIAAMIGACFLMVSFGTPSAITFEATMMRVLGGETSSKKKVGSLRPLLS